MIDPDRLQECARGDKAVAKEMLEEFADLLCEEMGKLDRIVSSANWREARYVAHAIRGASASVGAEGIWETACRMEQYARDEDAPAIEATLIELGRQASKFLSWYELPVRVA
ncbi:MAG: Hpt domain-containing protein [Armatimonadetes bacterium]|nr:Hpt domain-containing protein [Armatimonadota bacterium]